MRRSFIIGAALAVLTIGLAPPLTNAATHEANPAADTKLAAQTTPAFKMETKTPALVIQMVDYFKAPHAPSLALDVGEAYLAEPLMDTGAGYSPPFSLTALAEMKQTMLNGVMPLATLKTNYIGFQGLQTSAVPKVTITGALGLDRSAQTSNWTASALALDTKKMQAKKHDGSEWYEQVGKIAYTTTAPVRGAPHSLVVLRV